MPLRLAYNIKRVIAIIGVGPLLEGHPGLSAAITLAGPTGNPALRSTRAK